MFETDVLIIGGGPAGAATALGLLTYSDLKVMVVDYSDLTAERVGEHVSGAIFPLLSYLKIDRSDFEHGTFVASHSHSAAWGSSEKINRDNIFTTEIESYQLDRTLFELKLLETISERGGFVFPRTKCRSCSFKNSNWEVTLAHAERGKFNVRARFLVDATGRQISVCRMLGIPVTKKDKLTGVGMHMQVPENSAIKQTIEAVENGWWYHAFLPGGVATAVFFSDADLISGNKWNTQETWLKELKKTAHIGKYVDGCNFLTSNPWVRSAASQFTDTTGVSHFLAVGDSAAAFDPIASLGVGFAISCGCSAASAIQSDIGTGTETAVRQFGLDIQKNFSRFETTHRHFYTKEKRWPDSIFWQRRTKTL